MERPVDQRFEDTTYNLINEDLNYRKGKIAKHNAIIVGILAITLGTILSENSDVIHNKNHKLNTPT